MPTFAEIIQAVTDFVASNGIYIISAVVVGLMGTLVARLIRTGR